MSDELLDTHVPASNSDHQFSINNFSEDLFATEIIIPISDSFNWNLALGVVVEVS